MENHRRAREYSKNGIEKTVISNLNIIINALTSNYSAFFIIAEY